MNLRPDTNRLIDLTKPCPYCGCTPPGVTLHNYYGGAFGCECKGCGTKWDVSLPTVAPLKLPQPLLLRSYEARKTAKRRAADEFSSQAIGLLAGWLIGCIATLSICIILWAGKNVAPEPLSNTTKQTRP